MQIQHRMSNLPVQMLLEFFFIKVDTVPILVQVDTDPLPFSVTSAGAVLLVELAAVNLHLVFLLVALARSPEPAEGWYAPVRPIMYRYR